MKKLILLVSFCVFSTAAHADFAVIQDKDGFVNVRKEPDASATIAYKITNEPFYVLHKSKNGFYEILSKNHNGLDESYFIHKSRVQFVKSFSKLTSSYNSTGDSTELKGFGYLINLSSKPFSKENHNMSFEKNDNFSLAALDGFTKFWGSDGAVPYMEYKVFDIKYLGQSISITNKIKGDLFNPTIKNSKAYFDKLTKKLYLILENGDGAGVYHVVFVIKEGVVIDRLVVLDENV